ncbi:MAG: GDP-mannose 4,6-dehydratase, partial [Candidatus Rokubacteria bacterium]|nr:GDP-mannose 4,6-dehydratase [Candidatus Rokubacteria bacterium]
MRVFIAGIDGYLGWALAVHLAQQGHEVAGIDAYYRRDWVAEVGSQSATPIRRMTERLTAFHDHFEQGLDFRRGDLQSYNLVLNMFRSFEPEAIVHLGEMPSAPYS